MEANKVCIVIPVYKVNPNSNEKKSFQQVIYLLKNYQIILFSPSNLDIKYYLNAAKDFGYDRIKVENFKNHYFADINGYNKLLLSKEFYSRFLSYEYMLVYQLDAFVFSDQLLYWCKCDFDYIGAPIPNSNENKIEFIENAGNGGFSLRHVKSHLSVLKSKKRQQSLSELNRTNRENFNFFHYLLRIPYLLIRGFGYKNNINHKLKDLGQNEDVFWFEEAPKWNSNFKVAPFEASRKFAFEKHPEFLFKLNDNKLPFGCHAFEKYSPFFWELHI